MTIVEKNFFFVLALSSSNELHSEKVFFKRFLLSVEKNFTETKQSFRNCVKPDIEQFPKTFLNQTQRKNGGFLLHLFIAIYMFIALAIVCDDYFVPSLYSICKIFIG